MDAHRGAAHDQQVSRKRRGPTVAEVVQAVRDAPRAPPPEPPRGQLSGRDQLVDLQGRRHERVCASIGPAAALERAAAGAQVVWDPCGCGGYCGLRWFHAGEVARMVAAGRPSVHRKDPVAHLSAWAADDGSEVLLAVASVRWGGLLA